ncbi:uncharacterized protein NDAI_0E00110 [Naumovozyma dairenensis CBS 421]|uniref:Uncharacterized protein n=1 Tax=Naumovozyma dairenensis (strain ATCC 10597 / BCRC 20456 / CBS 421 / NBRC 0211 / NRRL Y-12639) TaxID=1071378 RepID=G0WAQ7_NAUDC|nr:hypothetical protein NDAI_0E00110 [Naumovozyma dairenensis CBS 421]CCD24827.1 hypothetical protein NDAI_0E00110 [Naumovozyma dairenensis CBS 421]
MQYPIITVPKGQFTIIDGFLINLNSKVVTDLSSDDSKTTLTPGGWYLLKNTYNPMSLTKLYFIDSNYMFTNKSVLLWILKPYIYVKFCERNSKYYCEPCTRHQATHKAISIPIVRLEETVSKYMVLEEPLTGTQETHSGPFNQQLKDQQVCETLNTEQTTTNNSDISMDQLKGFSLPDVKYIPEHYFIKIKPPITRLKIKNLEKKEEQDKVKELEVLQRSLFDMSLEKNYWRLRKMKEYFSQTGDPKMTLLRLN